MTDVLFREMMFLLSIIKQKKTEFHAKIDQAISAIDIIDLGSKFKSKILEYIISTQVAMSSQEEYEALQNYISPSLLREVSACIYYPIISLNPIMNTQSDSVEILVKYLSNIFTKPEQVIINMGDEADSMYFLVHGDCAVTMHNRYGVFEMIRQLNPGSHFGEIGVAYNTLRTANVVSLGYCTIARLTKLDYTSLKSMFSQLEEKIKTHAKQYSDPWKEYIISILIQARYLEYLPNDALTDIVYNADIMKLERGQYVFRRGEPVEYVYVIADGSVDLILTINDRHIHNLKKAKNIADVVTPNRKKLIKKSKDFSKYNFDISLLKNINQCSDASENDIKVGSLKMDFPQELVIDTLGQGTLIYPFFTLKNGVHSFKCKTNRQCTIYRIKASFLEKISHFHSQFKREFKRAAQMELKTHELLDYYTLDHKINHQAKKWKSTIISVILNSREKRRKFAEGFGLLLSKLRAVQLCHKAGNDDLADKIISGVIDPDLIMDDGTVDLYDFKKQNINYLPQSHPVIKSFNFAISSINSAEGSITKDYQNFKTSLTKENEKLFKISDQLDDLDSKLKKVTEFLLKNPKKTKKLMLKSQVEATQEIPIFEF